MRNDLHLAIDSITGEPIDNKGMGIMEQLEKAHKSDYKMYTGSSGIAMVKQLIRNMYPLTIFTDLLVFPHFEPYKVKIRVPFDSLYLRGEIYVTPKELKGWQSINEHPLDQILYSHARDFEIKMMKRLRAYIELENEL